MNKWYLQMIKDVSSGIGNNDISFLGIVENNDITSLE